jgi:hypothetical protein
MTTPRPQVFAMGVKPSWRVFLLLWGVRASRAFVRIDGDRLEARFGVTHLYTAVGNVAGWTITGPYRTWRAIGLRSNPPFRDWSFDTNPWHGVTLTFKRPVRFMRILRADTLTVTVTDADAFTAVLEARGIQGEDQRNRSS